MINNQTKKENNTMNYEEMKNNELMALCDELGVDVESKNVSKPTKAELIAALTQYDKETNEFLDDGSDDTGNYKDDVPIASNDKPIPFNGKIPLEDRDPATLTRDELRQLQRDQLLSLQRVIITSNDHTVTIKTKNRVNYVSWGNELLGFHTNRYVLGKKWILPRGAVNQLKKVNFTYPVQDEDENVVGFETVPMFQVVELPLPTEEEMNLMKKRQTILDEAASLAVKSK
jgi:hypothetical protein